MSTKPSLPELPLRLTGWAFFGEALNRTHSYSAGVIGIIASFVVGKYTEDQIPLWLFVATWLVLLTLSIAMVSALRQAAHVAAREFENRKAVEDKLAEAREALNAASEMIAVEKIVRPFHPFINAHCICLVTCKPPLQMLSNVTFFFVDDNNFERQLGSGTVRHGQIENQFQITLDHLHDEDDPFVKSVKNLEANAVARIRIARHSSLLAPPASNVPPQSMPGASVGSPSMAQGGV